jgi:N-acyl homoserine lactone hydrolase
MKMHFLSGGRLRLPRSFYFSDAARGDTIDVPVSCVLLRHPQGNVLFDTGCHPDVADDPLQRWGDLTRFMQPVMKRDDNVITGLNMVSMTPDDIDVVVCSHLHPDHCGCNAFFKRATFMIHRKEVEAARTAGAEKMGYLAQEWDLPVTIDALNDQRDLFGDDRIVLIPLPGHTPGTMGALVRLDKTGGHLLASDTVSLRTTLETGNIPRNSWNGDELAKSLDEVRHIEKGGVTVICGHDDAQWAALRKGADAYE